jgi:Uma2 family endonuclease
MDQAILKSDYERLRGKPMPSKNNAIVQGNLFFLLRKEYGATFRMLPEVSIQFDSKERIPDIAIYKSIEFTPGSDEIRLSEIPEVVIEILSPNQTLTELIEKSDLYFESGVPSYWLVIPNLRSIYIFSKKNEYEVFSKKEVLMDKKAGIELKLEEIFR